LFVPFIIYPVAIYYNLALKCNAIKPLHLLTLKSLLLKKSILYVAVLVMSARRLHSSSFYLHKAIETALNE